MLPLLHTARLLLRELDAGDLEAYHDMVGAEREAAERRLTGLLDRQERGEIMSWAICELNRRTLLGIIGLCRFNRVNEHAEVAYELRAPFRGRGYVSEALGAIAIHAFQRLGLHRLEGHVDPENIASIRVLERNRFLREGRLRENHRVDGVWHDTLIYARLASDRRRR